MNIPNVATDNQLPFSPTDRRIDSLGIASNIHSPDDAEAYIDAIFAKYTFDADSIPGLSSLKHRLAAAEYASLTDPSKLVSEAQLVDVFNKTMDEWGTERWTRISLGDFHRYHKIKAAVQIPYSVSRDPEGKVATTCRPVEALHLLFLLSIERGMQSDFKTLPDLPDYVSKGPNYADISDSWTPARPTDTQRAVFRRNIEYLNLRSTWLQRRFNLNPSQELGQMFDFLHVS